MMLDPFFFFCPLSVSPLKVSEAWADEPHEMSGHLPRHFDVEETMNCLADEPHEIVAAEYHRDIYV